MYVEEEHNGSDDDKDAYNDDDGIEDNNDDWDDAYLYLGPNISKSFTICGCSLTTAAANRR